MNTVLSTSDAQHVAGIGLRQQEDGWVVRINLREDDDGTRRKIPAEILGVPVVIEVTGGIRAQSTAGSAPRAAHPTASPADHSRLRLLIAAAALLAVTTMATLLFVLA
ncbi:hypothetical protein [Streptomyces phaeolivaceus]|nr:hypothetical protein [Streptomyces phaeolivaceus]